MNSGKDHGAQASSLHYGPQASSLPRSGLEVRAPKCRQDAEPYGVAQV